MTMTGNSDQESDLMDNEMSPEEEAEEEFLADPEEEEVTPAETSLASSSRSPMEVAAEEIARATARAQELRLSRWAGREVGGNTVGRAAPYTGRRTVGTAGKRRKGSGKRPAGTGRMSGR